MRRALYVAILKRHQSVSGLKSSILPLSISKTLSASFGPMQGADMLKAKLADQIFPKAIADVKEFRTKHGNTKIGEVTVDMVCCEPLVFGNKLMIQVHHKWGKKLYELLVKLDRVHANESAQSHHRHMVACGESRVSLLRPVFWTQTKASGMTLANPVCDRIMVRCPGER
jgi:hypothetical protein